MLVIKRKVGEQIRMLCKGEEIIISIDDCKQTSVKIGIEANQDNVYVMRDNCGCIGCNIHVGDRGTLVSFNNRQVIVCNWCRQKLENYIAIHTPLGIIYSMPTIICEYGNDRPFKAPGEV